MYSQGMARKTTTQKAEKLLKDFYKDKMQDIKFALLYGPKKDFSDIDIFMIGKGVPNEAHSDWLDVKYKSPKEFNNGLKNFDIRIIVPLMNGELIFGNKDYFKQSKQKVLSQPITESAIKHNLKWSSRMNKLKDENSTTNFLKNKFTKYSQTYLANALALRNGLKLFTKEDLLSYFKKGTLTELKGGIKEECN